MGKRAREARRAAVREARRTATPDATETATIVEKLQVKDYVARDRSWDTGELKQVATMPGRLLIPSKAPCPNCKGSTWRVDGTAWRWCGRETRWISPTGELLKTPWSAAPHPARHGG